MVPAREQVYEFGGYQLDAARRTLRRASEPVDLPPKVMETLVVLVEHHGELVEKGDLMKAIWPDSFVEEANLAVNISALRKVFEQGGTGERYIETVPRRGYRFVAPVREIGEGAAAPAQAKWRLRPAAMAAMTVVFVLAAVIGVPAVRRTLNITQDRAQGIHSVAVLPIQNLSGDPAQEYLADGLTESLITDLAQIRALRVISRSSAMTYKGTRKKLPEIARELNVDAVVEGSMARAGDRVQVTAQLIEAATDSHLWAKTFEGDMRDLLKLEAEAAQTIAQAVRVTLTPAEKTRLATVHLVNPDAHEAYLRGRYLWNKRTPEAMENSLALYQKATQIDPGAAEAYAAMASAYITVWGAEQYAMKPRELEAKAKAAAEKALAIDDGLAEPRGTLAWLKAAADYDWKGADAEFRRTIELDPNNATVHHWYGFALLFSGRYQEAYAETQKAAQLDPVGQASFNALTGALIGMRRWDEARARCRRLLDLEPNSYYGHLVMGDIVAATGNYAEAIREFQEGMRITPHNPGFVGRLGYVLALTGRTGEARAQLEEMERAAKSGYSPAGLRAWVEIGLGEYDRAIGLLEQAYSDRAYMALILLEDFHFDPLRRDPRFQALLKKVGLEQAR